MASPADQAKHSEGNDMEQAGIGILNANNLMTISTVRPDGWPQATVVGYANEGWDLYFLIYRDSQKFANIARDNRVAVAVASEPRRISEITAVYAGCEAVELLELSQRSRAWNLLAQRHPNLTDLAPPQSSEVATMVARCRHVSVLDYTQGLGHTESVTVSSNPLSRHCGH
jgi:nitroimidazol reductase NimA-like FMN-containing flavoprotein (pyridoxamine 5'-phosphate oxidase superfamily)